MGKTYYCDYCDRSFKDDVEARKKHLSSMQHMTNRANHYSMFKDPETILKEEYNKTPCKRYMTVGDCAFGPGCRFSHYTPSMIWELQQLAAMKNAKVSAVQPRDGWPNSEDIIKEYFENVIDSSGTEDLSQPTWSTPAGLVNYPYLPPSLRPVTSERMMDCDFSKWG
ncbi:PREDICTED: zinc finger matrin-type protein 5 [Wasmannia auropunctata]|uniref:zinc finger matrin-type protein 5 n=1 Tax=Wasmannia auropunctata TaxID=64793 RepID=UPI0005EFE199|nr:PREDICTED: zinc finger matrin-type protein 5 [Wasmannia auropunctata]